MLSKTRVRISMKQSFHMEAHLQRDFQEADNKCSTCIWSALSSGPELALNS